MNLIVLISWDKGPMWKLIDNNQCDLSYEITKEFYSILYKFCKKTKISNTTKDFFQLNKKLIQFEHLYDNCIDFENGEFVLKKLFNVINIQIPKRIVW